jgi:hypothetical protein
MDEVLILVNGSNIHSRIKHNSKLKKAVGTNPDRLAFFSCDGAETAFTFRGWKGRRVVCTITGTVETSSWLYRWEMLTMVESFKLRKVDFDVLCRPSYVKGRKTRLTSNDNICRAIK